MLLTISLSFSHSYVWVTYILMYVTVTDFNLRKSKFLLFGKK